MHGVYKVRVRNQHNSYVFELHRNITVLRGQSGRGKTTLFDMIREYNRFGKQSGVSVSCDAELIAVDGDNWEKEIHTRPGSIIVVDEDSSFVRSKDFAREIRGSDHYYLLITRNYLAELPISVDEIYELTGEKNKKFKRVYQEIERMFEKAVVRNLPFKPDVIITEDKRAGFEFFKNRADQVGIQCVSAEGKANVLAVLNQYPDRNVVVIADGAAFGAEISDVVEQQKLRPRKLAIFLPESFEWLILRSGVIPGFDQALLEQAADHADSALYFSWEQYFTDLIEQATTEPDFVKYRKTKLADYYLQERVALQILEQVKGIKLE